MDEFGNLSILDFITILSCAIGLENFSLSKQQQKNTAIKKEQQAKQTAMLETIIEQNKQIIELLTSLKGGSE